jgi:hypothetical protein
MGDLTPPRKSMKQEIAEFLAESLPAAIPFAGGLVTAVFMRFVGHSYEKRQTAFAQGVAERLAELSERVDGLTLEDLSDKPEFLDAYAHASISATMTSQQEKLEALRNAAVNVALSLDVDHDELAFFLRSLRDFEPSHLRLLALLQNPPKWFAENGIAWPNTYLGGSLARDVIEVGIPEFAGREALYSRVYTDLASAGLVNTSSPVGMMTGAGLEAKRTSALGDEFLRFVAEPRNEAPEPGSSA